jgi:hypothetical protein
MVAPKLGDHRVLEAFVTRAERRKGVILGRSSWRQRGIDFAQPPRSAEDEDMIAWIVRLLMIVAGAVTSWAVAEDAPNFGAIQMMVALLLLTLIVAVLAFWPSRWTIRLNRLQRSR